MPSDEEYIELRDELAAQAEAIRVLRDSAEAVLFLNEQEGETPNDTFERIAERYYQETRRLRPGKSVAPDRPEGTFEERMVLFDAWCDSKTKQLTAALAATAPKEPSE